ncbi:MAG: hypothetical protein AAFY88_01130 [Acidobacteriota bacterium]
MKLRVWLPLVLVALLWVPTVSADDAADAVNPLETVVAWVTSLWADFEATVLDPEPESADDDGPDEGDGDPLPSLGPWVEPHG